jgi:hypothetical protein
MRAGASASRPKSRNGRRTLASTVAHGIRVGSWNTKPICRWAGAAAAVAMSLAELDHSTAPPVGSLNPATMRSAVDLPQPEGPSRVRNSPGRTDRSKPSSATTPFANVLPTPRNATMDALATWETMISQFFGLNSTPTRLSTNRSV